MSDVNKLIPHMNQEVLTDRDELLGTGLERIALWEKIGEDYIPFPKQVDVLMSPAKEIYVCASRGSGKTHCAALRVIEELLLPNRNVYLIGPQYKHCKYVFETVLNAFKQSEFLKQHLTKSSNNRQDMSLETNFGSRGSKLIALSADNPDALIGMSSDLVVIDEAAIMSDDAFHQVRPSLNRLKNAGRLLAISSPRGDNWFQQNFKYAEKRVNDYKLKKGKMPTRPRLHAIKMHVLDNPFSDKNEYYAQLEETKMIDTSYRWAMFKREWEAEFDTAAGEVFGFTPDIWFPEYFYVPTPVEPIVIGVDYARLHDYCVCTAFNYDFKMVGFERWNQQGDKINIEKITKFIASLHRRGRRMTVVIDSTGEGSQIPTDVEDKLRVEYGITGIDIRGHKFTNTNKFELIETLQVKLANEDLALWDIPEIKHELVNYMAEETQSGKIVYKAGSGGTDDIIMSLALSVGNVPTVDINVL